MSHCSRDGHGFEMNMCANSFNTRAKRRPLCHWGLLFRVLRYPFRSAAPAPPLVLRRHASVRVPSSARHVLPLAARLDPVVLRRVLNVTGTLSLAVHRVRWQRPGLRIFRDVAAETDCAATHSRRVIRFQSLLRRLPEHLVVLDRGQPVGRGGGEVVACAETAAFDERSRAELLETGARRDQRLAASFCARVPVLQVFNFNSI